MFIRELKRDAALLFFFGWGVRVEDPSSITLCGGFVFGETGLSESGLKLEADTDDVAVALPFILLLIWEALIEASSSCSNTTSSSLRTSAALKDKARLNLPFSPPLLELSR